MVISFAFFEDCKIEESIYLFTGCNVFGYLLPVLSFVIFPDYLRNMHNLIICYVFNPSLTILKAASDIHLPNIQNLTLGYTFISHFL